MTLPLADRTYIQKSMTFTATYTTPSISGLVYTAPGKATDIMLIRLAAPTNRVCWSVYCPDLSVKATAKFTRARSLPLATCSAVTCHDFKPDGPGNDSRDLANRTRIAPGNISPFRRTRV